MTAIVARTAPTVPRLGLGRTGTAVALLLPIALINTIGFIVPVLNLLRMSFNEALSGGGIRETFTLSNWTGLFGDSFYVELIVNSITVSLGITLSTLLVSYPIALYLHRSSGRWRTFLTVLVISPLLTSAVLRTYGWIALLADQGPIVSSIAALGITPPRLMFNTTGVIIGLTEILMPYMILSLLAGFGRLDPRME